MTLVLMISLRHVKFLYMLIKNIFLSNETVAEMLRNNDDSQLDDVSISSLDSKSLMDGMNSNKEGDLFLKTDVFE